MEGRWAAVVVQQNNHLRPTLLSWETTLTKAERCWEILPGDGSNKAKVYSRKLVQGNRWMAKLIPTSFSFSERRQRGYQSEKSYDSAAKYSRIIHNGQKPAAFDVLMLFQSYSGSRSDGDVLAFYHGKARQTVPPPSVERVGLLRTSLSLRSDEIDVCLPLLTLHCPVRCAKTYRRQHIWVSASSSHNPNTDGGG